MNETIQLQLSHKSIRAFTDKKLSPEQVDTLIHVAQRTSTSSFMQAYSIVGVTDMEKKKALAEVGNQKYIADASHVFVMLVDQKRNSQIAKENGKDPKILHSMDKFMSAYADALLASQNIMLAAESMGLGGVFLGSLLNDAPKVAEVIKAPEYTFPVLGIAIGYPDQEPQLKPRLPQHFMYSENEYTVPQENLNDQLTDYDEIVTQYYDLRSENRRMDSWTNLVTNYSQNQSKTRSKVLNQIKDHGLISY
jgi:nitroreductase